MTKIFARSSAITGAALYALMRGAAHANQGHYSDAGALNAMGLAIFVIVAAALAAAFILHPVLRLHTAETNKNHEH